MWLIGKSMKSTICSASDRFQESEQKETEESFLTF